MSIRLSAQQTPTEEPGMIAQFQTTPGMLVHAVNLLNKTMARFLFLPGFEHSRVFITVDGLEIDPDGIENITSASAVIDSIAVINSLSR